MTPYNATWLRYEIGIFWDFTYEIEKMLYISISRIFEIRNFRNFYIISIFIFSIYLDSSRISIFWNFLEVFKIFHTDPQDLGISEKSNPGATSWSE